MGTPFSMYDDEEARKRLDGASISPGQLEAPVAESPSDMAMRWLGSGAGSSPYGTSVQAQSAMPQYEIPDPPHKTAGTGGLIAAAIADLVLNKGRSLPMLIGTMATNPGKVAEDNWRMDRQVALDRASIAQSMRGKGVDPETARLRQLEADLRGREIANNARKLDMAEHDGGTKAEKLAQDKFDFEKSHYGEVTDAQREALDMRRQAMEDAASSRKDASSLRYEMLQDRLSRQREQDDIKRSDAESTKARQFTTDTAKYLNLGQEVQSADALIKRYPTDIPGVGEIDSRLMNNELPLVGAGREGIEARKTLGFLRDTLARIQSGAAFAGKEKEDLYRIAAGLDSSNEAEIRAAIKGMSEFVKNNVRARRVGREAAADHVLQEMGLSDWVGASSPTRTPENGLGTTTGKPPKVHDALLEGMGVRFK